MLKIKQIFSRLDSRIGALHPALKIVGIAILSVLYCFPNIDWQPFLPSAYSLFNQQIDRPFEEIQSILFSMPTLDTHFKNTAFRLSLPLLGHITGWRCNTFIHIQLAMLPIFIFVLYRVMLMIMPERRNVWVWTAAFSFTYFTHAFIQLYPYFDAFAFLLLLSVLLVNNHCLRWLLLVIAFGVDERAIVASANIYLILYVVSGKNISLDAFIKDKAKYSFMAAWGFVFLLRYLLRIMHDFSPEFSFSQWNLMLFMRAIPDIFMTMMWTFKGFLLLPLIYAFTLWKNRDYINILLLFVFPLVQIIYIPMTADFTRGVTYLFPYILLLLAVFSRENRSVGIYHKLSWIVLSLSIALPSYYIIRLNELHCKKMYSFFYFYL